MFYLREWLDGDRLHVFVAKDHWQSGNEIDFGADRDLAAQVCNVLNQLDERGRLPMPEWLPSRPISKELQADLAPFAESVLSYVEGWLSGLTDEEIIEVMTADGKTHQFGMTNPRDEEELDN